MHKQLKLLLKLHNTTEIKDENYTLSEGSIRTGLFITTSSSERHSVSENIPRKQASPISPVRKNTLFIGHW